MPQPQQRQLVTGAGRHVRANNQSARNATSPTGHGESWGEAEFGTLQKKASGRLHRFYVPHPLGPVTSSPSLEALLLETGAATPAPSHSPASLTGAAAGAAPPASAPAPMAGTKPKRSRSASAATAAGQAAATRPLSPASAPPSSPSAPAVCPSTVVLEGDEARHAARALRLQAGDRVELCDGRGNVVEGTVSGSDKQRMWVTAAGPGVHVPWVGPRWVVAVACTTLKGDRTEWLVEKLTELGAHLLVPLVTERSQACGKAKFRTRGGSSSGSAHDSGGESDGDYQPGRLERIAIAATKQSLRPHALGLAPPTPLADVLPLVRALAGARGRQREAASRTEMQERRQASGGHGSVDGAGAGSAAEAARALSAQPATATALEDGEEPALHLDVGGGLGVEALSGGGRGDGGFSLVAVAGAPPLRAVLDNLLGTTEPACAPPTPAAGGGGGNGLQQPVRVLFIGPEGDFTPGELAAIVGAGARPVGLGANRLRTETAAMGLLSACIFAEV